MIVEVLEELPVAHELLLQPGAIELGQVVQNLLVGGSVGRGHEPRISRCSAADSAAGSCPEDPVGRTWPGSRPDDGSTSRRTAENRSRPPGRRRRVSDRGERKVKAGSVDQHHGQKCLASKPCGCPPKPRSGKRIYARECPAAKRCGCPWRFRVDGPDGLDGSRHTIIDHGYPHETSARAALLAMQRRLGAGEIVGKSDTVATYLGRWLDEKRATLKPFSIGQYEDLARRFLIPHLGRIKLNELRAVHVEEMLAAMVIEGRGITTQRRTIATLLSALGSAVKRRLVTLNVCTQLELPPERPARRPVWDADELMRFLVAVRSDRLAALWRLYAIVGLRRGEALALTWSNLDLDARTIRIERSLVETGGHLVVATPKTTNGRRTISLDDETVTWLREHRAAQNRERLELGEGYRNEDLVFCREDGALIWPGSISDRFHVLSTAAGLPAIRLHDARHSAATRALASGVDLKTVGARLGHSGIAITADRYAHVLTAADFAAAERVANMVKPKTVVSKL